MNFYFRYPGDYSRDTGHLSLAEHGAYNLLLDYQYATEKSLPININASYRICRAMTAEEEAAVRSVVEEFFPGDGVGRINPRAWEELAKASARSLVAHRNGAKGGRPKTRLVVNPNYSPNNRLDVDPNNRLDVDPNNRLDVDPKNRPKGHFSAGILDVNPNHNPNETQTITQTITQTKAKDNPKKSLSRSRIQIQDPEARKIPSGSANVDLNFVSQNSEQKAPAVPVKKKSRKAQFPDSLVLTPERTLTLAKYDPSANAVQTWEVFKDYHQAKGSVMANWDAAWRTWCGNSRRFSGVRAQPSTERIDKRGQKYDTNYGIREAKK